MAFNAIHSGTQLEYQLYRVHRDDKSLEARLTSLKLVCGPVITIMLPGED